MWLYQKKLEYPVRIKNTNPRLAKFIISQYQERYGENDNYVKKAPEYKDMGWDNYDMTYDDQAERIKPEITEIDPYEHNFDINIQKIKTKPSG